MGRRVLQLSHGLRYTLLLVWKLLSVVLLKVAARLAAVVPLTLLLNFLTSIANPRTWDGLGAPGRALPGI